VRTRTEEANTYRIRCVSYPPKDLIFEAGEVEAIKKRFDDILLRERWSFSHGVWMAVTEYADRHSPGNPAQTLTRFLEGKPLYRAPKGRCQLKGCPNLAFAVVEHPKSGLRREFCQNHIKEALASGAWVRYH
jgi:hypothetical protein